MTTCHTRDCLRTPRKGYAHCDQHTAALLTAAFAEARAVTHIRRLSRRPGPDQLPELAR